MHHWLRGMDALAYALYWLYFRQASIEHTLHYKYWFSLQSVLFSCYWALCITFNGPE